MGVYECENCDEIVHGESFWCESCGYAEATETFCATGAPTAAPAINAVKALLYLLLFP